MNKNCGTCKWWVEDESIKMVDVKACSYPIPTLPISFIEFVEEWEAFPMDKTDGHLCKTYEAKP